MLASNQIKVRAVLGDSEHLDSSQDQLPEPDTSVESSTPGLEVIEEELPVSQGTNTEENPVNSFEDLSKYLDASENPLVIAEDSDEDEVLSQEY